MSIYMDYKYLHGLQGSGVETIKTAAKVRECGLGMRLGLYAGLICDDSAAEAALVVLYNCSLPLRFSCMYVCVCRLAR